MCVSSGKKNRSVGYTLMNSESSRFFLCCVLTFQPYTLHPTPYTLHPTPHTLHLTPYTLPRVFSVVSLPDVSELCVGSAFLGAVSYYRTSAQPNTQGLGAFDLGGFLYLFFLGFFVFFSLQVALGISDYR